MLSLICKIFNYEKCSLNALLTSITFDFSSELNSLNVESSMILFEFTSKFNRHSDYKLQLNLI